MLPRQRLHGADAPGVHAATEEELRLAAVNSFGDVR